MYTRTSLDLSTNYYVDARSRLNEKVMGCAPCYERVCCVSNCYHCITLSRNVNTNNSLRIVSQRQRIWKEVPEIEDENMGGAPRLMRP
jgi:hypothetical protein